MSEYVIEKLTGQTRVYEGTYKIFLFKIDKYGNLDIKSQHITSGLGGTQFSAFQSELVINDNIPIPIYLIETIQKLLHPDAATETQASYFDNSIQV